MIIDLPTLVIPHKDPDEGGSIYSVRPLFFDRHEQSDRDLQQAETKLARQLRKHLRELGRDGEHEILAEYTFAPDAALHWLKLTLDLRNRLFRGRFPVVTFRHFQRTIAFCPRLPEVWFDVAPDGDLKSRATEVYTRHFRSSEKENDEADFEFELRPFSKEHAVKPWLSFLTIEVSTRQKIKSSQEDRLSLFGPAETMDGEVELEKVGRCLEQLFPHNLDRALYRQTEVEEIEAVLSATDKRPVALIGPAKVGKTTLIHEYVCRRLGRRKATLGSKKGVWLISPQRLISGMSYVGQWENRLLAILKTARKRKHTLYFDDLLGAYHAGITRNSPLSVADVLKPYVERREIRLLVEMTPEQLNVFRERDRGFADMFHLINIEEPAEEETIRILLGVVRTLEARYQTRFNLDVLPTVLELTRRYQRESAFPGKAAVWLGQLALKYRKQEITRDATLDAFADKSGLDLTFLDTRTRLDRQSIERSLSSEIIGQRPAIDAMADVLSIAKARLNDPQKPLGSLLFVGPTGVGKTQSAKALTKYLFGDESRLLRFDMNEFISPRSAARLVGTFDSPEGLLTSAVRRQPFGVVLFDEIEKAHSDVFDLMLQILGEARLTDALGRTVDFGNAIVILTSNLGTREGARDVGFAPSRSDAQAVYLKAVENFFRPEFFNRLDRVVPFTRLDRDELRKIACVIIDEVLARDGLARRKSAVELAGDALDWVIDRGYHPTFGARAMARAVEREMVRPIARHLAAIKPETPTVLRFSRHGDSLGVEVHALPEARRLAAAARPESFADRESVVGQAAAAMDRIETACAQRKPVSDLTAGRISPEYCWYLGVTEFLQHTRTMASRIGELLHHPPRRRRPIAIEPTRQTSRKGPRRWNPQPTMSELLTAEDIHQYLKELAAEADLTRQPDEIEQALADLLDRIALLDMLGPGESGWASERAAVIIRGLDNDVSRHREIRQSLIKKYNFSLPQTGGRTAADIDGMELGLDFTCFHGDSSHDPDTPGWAEQLSESDRRRVEPMARQMDVVLFEGPRAQEFLAIEQGTHVFGTDDGRLVPLQVAVLPLDRGDSLGTVLAGCLDDHARCLDATARHEEPPCRDPLGWLPVVAVYAEGHGLVTDLRTGLVARPGGSVSESDALTASLPLPPEFQE